MDRPGSEEKGMVYLLSEFYPFYFLFTRVEKKKVNMKVAAFVSGKSPIHMLKELELEEHLECGCMCQGDTSRECRQGQFSQEQCRCICTQGARQDTLHSLIYLFWMKRDQLVHM